MFDCWTYVVEAGRMKLYKIKNKKSAFCEQVCVCLNMKSIIDCSLFSHHPLDTITIISAQRNRMLVIGQIAYTISDYYMEWARTPDLRLVIQLRAIEAIISQVLI